MVNNFVASLTVAASVFTLMAITLDRYRAILHPLKPKLSRAVIMGVIAAVWVASGLLSLPALLFSTTVSFRWVKSLFHIAPVFHFLFYRERTTCLLYWPDGLPSKSMQDYV